MQKITVIFLSLAAFQLACDASVEPDAPAPDPVVEAGDDASDESEQPAWIHPGETSEALGDYLSYASGGSSASDGTTNGDDVCDYAQKAGSVAIIELVSDPDIVREPLCESDYGGPADKWAVKTLAVVAGLPLKPEFIAVNVEAQNTFGGFSKGERYLMTIREDGNEWFFTHANIELEIVSDPDEIRPSENTQLPTTFDELVTQIQKRVANYDRICPGPKLTEEAFHEYIRVHQDCAYDFDVGGHTSDDPDAARPGQGG